MVEVKAHLPLAARSEANVDVADPVALRKLKIRPGLIKQHLSISLDQDSHVVVLFARRYHVQTVSTADFEGEGLGGFSFERKTQCAGMWNQQQNQKARNLNHLTAKHITNYRLVSLQLVLIWQDNLKNTMNHPRANSFLGSFPACSFSPSVVNHHIQHTPSSHQSRDKSDKFLSDRFLPLRRGPSASRELFTDSVEWSGAAERYGGASDSQPGHQVKDVYRAEILGESLDKEKRSGFEFFSNDNFLRYNLKEQTNREFESLFDKRVIASQIQPKKKSRKFNKFPYRVLDAPLLLNDFYLNLLDWSNLNQLGVGLARNVYLWDANSLKTHQLFTVGERRYVTSVSFSPSNVLAVGANDGTIQLWDCNRNRCVHSYFGQQDRVGSLSWKNSTIIASGSRDYSIMIRDTRAARPVIKTLNHHNEEVCGVKWSNDEHQLASGGIDNKLVIWEMHYPKPVFSIQRHTAAVKALAWSPHQHGLLATGGGSKDSTIRMWNSLTGEELSCMYVGSQVSNLLFGKTTNELVSTHGYNLNEINIWNVPNMERIVTLRGHTSRVLFMAMSPDGASIVTGGADESLRFWKVFPPQKKEEGMRSKLSNDATSLR